MGVRGVAGGELLDPFLVFVADRSCTDAGYFAFSLLGGERPYVGGRLPRGVFGVSGTRKFSCIGKNVITDNKSLEYKTCDTFGQYYSDFYLSQRKQRGNAHAGSWSIHPFLLYGTISSYFQHIPI